MNYSKFKPTTLAAITAELLDDSEMRVTPLEKVFNELVYNVGLWSALHMVMSQYSVTCDDPHLDSPPVDITPTINNNVAEVQNEYDEETGKRTRRYLGV